jgi:hypothetical protein
MADVPTLERKEAVKHGTIPIKRLHVCSRFEDTSFSLSLSHPLCLSLSLSLTFNKLIHSIAHSLYLTHSLYLIHSLKFIHSHFLTTT